MLQKQVVEARLEMEQQVNDPFFPKSSRDRQFERSRYFISEILCCFQACEADSSILVSRAELGLEYDNCIKLLQLEQDRIIQAEKKKLRRKIPKAGCYPSGFSEFTMKRVACTISLNELRKDLSALTSVLEYPSQSVYFEESGVVDAVGPIATCAKTNRQPEAIASAPRNCRRKLTQVDLLLPRSIAEERRQLQEVLRQSVMEQQAVPGTMQRVITSKISRFDKLQYRSTNLDFSDRASLLDRNSNGSPSLVPSA